ncbi:F0F1 ATP synthase subunit alpha [Oscillospiraceae bacterium KA00274]|nr:F0F1 ATP synthase subunit alpha [Amygdalobacter nucleatus]
MSDELAASLKDEFAQQKQELGEVKKVADGIAHVSGLSHCLNGEMIIFASGAIGLAMNLEKDSIGVVLLTMEDSVHSGMTCKGSSQVLSVPSGSAFLGQVIDPLGRSLEGEQNLQVSHYRPIEFAAPAIIDRQQVDEPLYTGITAIDSMIPIGKGQRELIIGDRQTGKSTIALDTILNQKGKDVVCIYVAIGQKQSTLKSQVTLLRERGAMDYTVVVSASASVSAALQYVAPYAACAMAEEFMYAQHRDVLIIYDDLTKHAQAYRAISLLLHRPPGREAYPGDVFYIHSRLLERAARLSDALGGGSITAIPIVETQAGDISAYIPTNVISITDGQIYLESDLFFSGQRPAINVGLSVSRVGGSCQVKSMRKVAGPLRITMAQFRELQSFSQLSSEMDASSAKQITRGLRLNEVLKQSEHVNRSLADSLILLTLCTNGAFDKLDIPTMRRLLHDFVDYLKQVREDILLTFSSGTVVSDSDKQMLYDLFADYCAEHDSAKAEA